MKPLQYGLFPALSILWIVTVPGNGQYQDMVCEDTKSRTGRKMTEPGPGCDMSTRNWCNVETPEELEKRIMEVILDNRGIMKRLFGDQREARFLEAAFESHEDDVPKRPPPLAGYPKRKAKKVPLGDEISIENGKFHNTDVLSNARHGKKIYSSMPTDMRVKSLQEELKNIRQLKDDFDLTPSRSNDKVFSKTFETKDKRYKVTTKTGDEIDTTQPTTFQDDFTTSQDYLTLEPEESFVSEPTPFPDEVEESIVITTENGFSITKENIPVKKNNINQTNKKLEETTAGSLDLGDDLSYTKNGSSRISVLSETVSLPASSSRPTTVQQRQKIRTPYPNRDNLEGRGEYPSSSFQSSNSRPRRPQFTPPSNRQRPSSNFEKPSSTPQERPSSTRERPSSNQFREDVRPPTARPQVTNSPPYQMEKFPACNSTTEVIAPTWAKNIQGKNLIVVNVGSFMQHLHVEECDKASLYRKMYCQRGCRCEQQYRLQKLLVIDPDDECRGIFSDWFRFPSCCVCVCYPSSMLRAGSRNARIIDEDEDYWTENDDHYEDDPFVDHYYGLDLDEDFYTDDKEDDMITSASQSDYVLPIESEKNIKESNSLNFQPNYNKPQRRVLNATKASPEKKSRLLGNLSRTINIRPQQAPRRYPPPRTGFNIPWARPLWNQMAQFNRKFNSASTYQSSSRRIGLFSESRRPKFVYAPQSLDNVNVDTYYNQNKPIEAKENILKRIPRSHL